MKIHLLLGNHAIAFQVLRLLALQESPSAFGASYEEECYRTLEQVEDHLVGSEERRFFGYFNNDELLGMVGVGREQGIKQSHTAFVRSMYVAPAARGQGVGRRLLTAAIEQAWEWRGVEQLSLAVTASNEPAVKLYENAGFVKVGRLPRALHIGGHYYDELQMVLMHVGV